MELKIMLTTSSARLWEMSRWAAKASISSDLFMVAGSFGIE